MPSLSGQRRPGYKLAKKCLHAYREEMLRTGQTEMEVQIEHFDWRKWLIGVGKTITDETRCFVCQNAIGNFHFCVQSPAGERVPVSRKLQVAGRSNTRMQIMNALRTAVASQTSAFLQACLKVSMFCC